MPRSREIARGDRTGRTAKLGWLLLGLLCVCAGLVGSVVPLMPTTIFLILGAGCFARSSPRLEAWLLGHPRFGAPIRAWRTERAVPRVAKRAACIAMAMSYALFCLATRPVWGIALGTGLAILASALWIVTRPDPARTE